MPYIYKITNRINGKIYIGKTIKTIQERWKEHCSDYQKERYEKRPLYSAMNKYGIEHFYIEPVEECSVEFLSEREKFWIEYYGSFKNGYNATIGGDGKQYVDYDLVVANYKKIKNQTKVAELMKISTDTVAQALRVKKEKILTQQEVQINERGYTIYQYDKYNNFLKSFPSARAAAREVSNNSNGASHILDVCKGKRKTAYGYYWKYEDASNSEDMGS